MWPFGMVSSREPLEGWLGIYPKNQQINHSCIGIHVPWFVPRILLSSRPLNGWFLDAKANLVTSKLSTGNFWMAKSDEKDM